MSGTPHKYKVGEKVRIVLEAEITEVVPHTFNYPGYYVKVQGSKLAVSEQSIVGSQDRQPSYRPELETK